MRVLTGGKGASSVIVAAPSARAIETGINVVRKGGTLLIFGGCPSDSFVSLDPNLIHYSEITITGSIDSTIEDFHRSINLLSRVDLKPFITHSFPLESIKEAMELIDKRKGLKVILKF